MNLLRDPTAFIGLWDSLPLVAAEHLPVGRRPLILAPHPDDETLGCGGLIAAWSLAGQPPVVAVLTDGSGSHPNLDSASRVQLKRQREAEVRRATGLLNLPVENLALLEVPDGQLGQAEAPSVMRLIELARRHRCDSILAPSRLDRHPDHVAAARIGDALGTALILPVFAYLTWAWVAPGGDAAPPLGWRVAIGPYLHAKRRAIVAHESQFFGLAGDPLHHCLPADLLAAAQRDFEVILRV